MSTSLSLHLEGDNCWNDLLDRRENIIHLGEGSHMEMAALSGGMTSGNPSVAIRIDLPDGKIVIQETSMRLFLSAADAFRAKYQREIR